MSVCLFRVLDPDAFASAPAVEAFDLAWQPGRDLVYDLCRH